MKTVGIVGGSGFTGGELIRILFNHPKFEIKFRLKKGDLLMMDNYRLLHGRTSYDTNEGNRFLQGCYIDYDSTEGKLKHLKRKYKNKVLIFRRHKNLSKINLSLKQTIIQSIKFDGKEMGDGPILVQRRINGQQTNKRPFRNPT